MVPSPYDMLYIGSCRDCVFTVSGQPAKCIMGEQEGRPVELASCGVGELGGSVGELGWSVLAME